jgi:DNA-binding GntR family transcriptional regulator
MLPSSGIQNKKGTIIKPPEDKKPSVKDSDAAYAFMRERIVAGHYAPGQQIKEEPVARDLGMSRTPVRAALKRLIDDGLATSGAGQGVHVVVWGDMDIEETFHLRMLLEPYAASLAAERGGEAMVRRLRELNADMAAGIGAQDVEKIQLTNRAFHQTLLDHCASPRLRAILEGMADIPILSRSFYLSDQAELEQSLRHHEELTLACADGDAETARKAMELHLRAAYRRFVRRRADYQAAARRAAGDAPSDHPGGRR